MQIAKVCKTCFSLVIIIMTSSCLYVLQMDWVGVAIQWVERRVGPDVVEQLIATINSHLLESSQLMLGSEVSGRITNISTIPFITILHLRKLEVNTTMYSRTSAAYCSGSTHHRCLDFEETVAAYKSLMHWGTVKLCSLMLVMHTGLKTKGGGGGGALGSPQN